MLNVKIICVGNLKENYLKEAAAEYIKRLSAFCRLEIAELREHKLPDAPSEVEIGAALEEEADRILTAIPPRAAVIPLCVEGKQFSSEELSKKLDGFATSHGAVCLIIGSSHGLSPRVKSRADLRLSVSELTFPHQLMRVLLLEVLYRCLNIQKGTRYHK
jgi:23S rRNA (pseudouridine1915-N3)-methyltransferase